MAMKFLPPGEVNIASGESVKVDFALKPLMLLELTWNKSKTRIGNYVRLFPGIFVDLKGMIV